MAQRVELSAEDREELAYKLICWMKKWGLWEDTTLFSRETNYSSDIISKLARPGWRGWEDVWTSPYTGEFREELDTAQFLVECSRTLETLLEFKLYAAEFDSLPADTQTALLRRTDLFEACVDWYGEYLESGGGVMIRNLIPLMNIGYWSQSTGMTSSFGCLWITCMRRCAAV